MYVEKIFKAITLSTEEENETFHEKMRQREVDFYVTQTRKMLTRVDYAKLCI